MMLANKVVVFQELHSVYFNCDINTQLLGHGCISLTSANMYVHVHNMCMYNIHTYMYIYMSLTSVYMYVHVHVHTYVHVHVGVHVCYRKFVG